MAQSPTQSLAAALTEFQDSLNPPQKAQLLALSTQTAPDANAVLVFTAEVDRTNQRRKSRCVASRMQKTLQFIQQFSGAVDTFVASDPSTAALAWGSIKVTILAASNYASYFDKLSKWFIKLEGCCPRYAEYQFLFADAPGLQKALCEFYATVIRFCTRSIKIVQRTGVAQFAKSVWKSFEKEFGPFEDKLQRQSKDVQEEIGLASEKAAARERQLQIIERKTQSQHRTLGRLFHDRFDRVSEEERNWKINYDDQKKRARKQFLLDKLSPYDYISALKQLRKKRYGTTSTWLKETSEYKLWLNESKSSVFWLSGILGSGKSVLTAALIDELLCNELSNEVSVGFFFCQHDRLESLEARTIMGSLVRQFLTVETMSETMREHLERLCTNPFFSDDEMKLLLKCVVDTSRKYFIVVDGFDECSPQDRRFILSILRETSSSPSIIKIFISSRHDSGREIKKAFGSCFRRTMNCQEAHRDIEIYIKTTIEERRSMDDLVVGDPELLHEVEEALIRGARGMFLWVFFQVEDICAQTCDEDIRTSIRTLPADLPQTFERALASIVKSRKTELVIKIFRWVAAVNRPLSLYELREAIAIRPCQEFLKPDQLVNDISQVVSWCANLVIVDEEEYLVQFAHYTVKEYLLSYETSFEFQRFRLDILKIDQEAGETCVTYLSLNDFKTELIKGSSVSPTSLEPISIAKSSLAAANSSTVLKSWTKLEKFLGRTRVKNFDILQQLHSVSSDSATVSMQKLRTRYSFLAYASEHWLSHTSNFTTSFTDLWRLWRNLVQNEDTIAARPWTSDEWCSGHDRVKQYIVEYSHWALLFLFRNSVSNSYLNDTQITKILLTAAERADKKTLSQVVSLQLQDPRPSSHLALDKAVEIAAKGSRVRLIDALKLDTMTLNGVSLSEAMVSAARNGDQALTSRLLYMLKANKSNSSSVKIENVESVLTAALRAAESYGGRGVFQRLIDVRTASQVHPTELQQAIIVGDVKAVKSLIYAQPIDDLDKATLLQSAVRLGHIQIVKLLITAYGKVNARTSPTFFFTALGVAAEMGRIEIVKLLIANNADVNISSRGPLALTALQAAARYGYIEIVNLLIAEKANVNAEGGDCTALQTAAGNGHVEVVKLLISNGADVNVSVPNTDTGYTALQAAAQNGHIEIVKLLIAEKAEFNTLGVRRTMPLSAAAAAGHIEIVKLLIVEKADVNAKTFRGMTALEVAARKGHLEVVKLLIAEKADVNAQTVDGGTALEAAARNGHIEVVKLLIAEKADVNAKTFRGMTALEVAARKGHLEVVKLLIAEKADVNAQTVDGGTALEVAARNGHLEVVKLLIAEKPDVNAVAIRGSALINAVRGEHIEVVKLLLARKDNFIIPESYVATALCFAASSRDFEMEKLLTARTSDLNWKISSGMTALEFAAREGYIEVVKLLIARKADFNFSQSSVTTALRFAARNGHIEVVKLLIAEKVDVNAQTVGWGTALEAAARNGHIEVVKLLIAEKVDVNAQTVDGGTALEAAASNGHIEVVKLLIAGKANVNAQTLDGGTALEAAARNGHIEVVKLLIAEKADVNARTFRGMTALEVAARNGHIEVVKLLIAGKADVNARTKGGATALEVAARNGHIELVKLLIAGKADVNARTKGGATALEVAARNGHIEVVKLLIAGKANVNAQTLDGGTALEAAARNGQIEVVKLLIAGKADVDAQTVGWVTALEVAARNGHIEVVKLLMAEGADVPGTVLRAAIKSEHRDIVDLVRGHWTDRDVSRAHKISPPRGWKNDS